MTSHRLGARIASANLSPEQLCALFDEMGPLLSDEALCVAEKHVTQRVEQPEWILNQVLLDKDLAYHILSQLPTNAHAAKGTCRAWRGYWKETLKTRKILTVIGGQECGFCSIERYDPSVDEWDLRLLGREPRWPARATQGWISDEARRGLVEGAVMMESKLYMLMRPMMMEPCMHVYDLVSEVCEKKKTPEGWFMDRALWSPALGALDGKLYVMGGRIADDDDEDYGLDGGGRVCNVVERYDPANDSWATVASMAAARKEHAAAALGGKLYVVGGMDMYENELRSVELYDPDHNAWEAVAPMAIARSCHSVASLNGKLYVLGGCLNKGNGTTTGSVERYDPVEKTWEAVAPMAEARSDAAVAVVDGALYVAGGFERAEMAECARDYYRLDPSKRWVYSEMRSVERYDPVMNAWETVAPMDRPRAFAVAF